MRAVRLLVALTLAGSACRDSLAPTAPRHAVPRPPLAQVVVSAPVDLGTFPGGDFSVASAINNLGEVVGYSTANPSDLNGGFRWTAAGGMVALGISEAIDVNDRGQVVGYSPFAGGAHATLWTPTEPGAPTGTLRDLGALGGGVSVATAINERGDVVGFSYVPGSEFVQHAFRWTAGGGMIDLDIGAGQSSAEDINDLGQIVGSYTTADGYTHAFLWTPTAPGAPTGTLTDLGTLGGDPHSFAYGINNLGQVVGYSSPEPGLVHAFLWTPTSPGASTGTMTALSTVSEVWSTADAINDLGHVVGTALLGADGASHAYFWTAEDGVIDLGPGGASAVSNRGPVVQVVGAGQTADGFTHAMLWTVTLAPPSPAEAIADLRAAVQQLVDQDALSPGQGRGLCAKLDAATRQLGARRPGPAANILHAFINQVEAYVHTGVLGPAQGRDLIGAAESVMAQLTA